MARPFDDQANATNGNYTLDPWYKRMLLMKLDEDFDGTQPAPSSSPKPTPVPVPDAEANPFLRHLDFKDTQADRLTLPPLIAKANPTAPTGPVEQSDDALFLSGSYGFPFFVDPAAQKQQGFWPLGAAGKNKDPLESFLDGLLDPWGRNKGPQPGTPGGNTDRAGTGGMGFGIPESLIQRPDWLKEQEAKLALNNQVGNTENQPNPSQANNVQGEQPLTPAETAEQQLRKHISEGRYDLVLSILGHSKGGEALKAIGVDVDRIAEEAGQEKLKHHDLRKEPFWENMDKNGKTYAIVSNTPSGEQVFIAPGYGGTLSVYKKWMDGAVTQVGGPYDSVQAAQSDVAGRWDSILNGPGFGKVLKTALKEGGYSLGANLGRPILDLNNIGKYKDPFAEAQKVLDNRYIYDGLAMKTINDYYKYGPPSKSQNPIEPILQFALPARRQDNLFMQQGNKVPNVMFEDAKNYYRGQAIEGLKKFTDKGYQLNDLEYDPVFGVQPIPPGTPAEGRNLKYMQLLNKLGVVDDTMVLAAEVMYNLAMAQKLNDERKTNNWWLQTAGNVTSGLPSFAAGVGLTALDPAVGILYNVTSGYGGNANEAMMEGASYDKATEYALWNIPLNVATSLGPGKGGSKFLKAVVDLGSPALQRIGSNLIKKGVYKPDMPIFGEGGVLDPKQMLDVTMQAAAYNVFSKIIGNTSGKAKEYSLKKFQNNETPDFEVAQSLLREDADSNDAGAKKVIESIDALQRPADTAGDAVRTPADAGNPGPAQGDAGFLDGLTGGDKPLTPEEKTALAAGIKPQDAAGEAAALRAGLGLDEEQAKTGADGDSPFEQGLKRNDEEQTANAGETDGNRENNTPVQIEYNIAKLNKTDVFSAGKLEHILEGDVKNNNAVGYHYEGMPNSKGKIIPGTKTTPNALGVYRGKVEVNGVKKSSFGGYSTFYPETWTPQQVVDAINEAYINKQPMPGRTDFFFGFTSEGMEIRMYINQAGQVQTAYPVY